MPNLKSLKTVGMLLSRSRPGASGQASGAPCGLVGGSVSHQRSPLVPQGCQRAKRPCSCPNKTLGYRLQSVLGARSAPSEKVRFSTSISKILKSSWLLGQIPKLVLKPAKEPEAQNPQKSAVLRILGVGYGSLLGCWVRGAECCPLGLDDEDEGIAFYLGSSVPQSKLLRFLSHLPKNSYRIIPRSDAANRCIN